MFLWDAVHFQALTGQRTSKSQEQIVLIKHTFGLFALHAFRVLQGSIPLQDRRVLAPHVGLGGECLAFLNLDL
jgi:hypothetical protein